jgi:hypothetical protein
LPPLGRIERQEGTVGRQGVQERQQRRDGLLDGLVQGQEVPRDVGPDGTRLVPVLDVQIALEQIDDRDIGRGFPIRDRGTLYHQPPLGSIRAKTLIDEAGLAHPWLSHQRHHLAMAAPSRLQRVVEVIQFTIPPDETGEPPDGSRLQP